MEISRDLWEGMTDAERQETARRLARQLPSGFAFQEISFCGLGEQRHPVAFFQQGNARFALLPGESAATLGFDANRWEPNPDEQESWQGMAEEYEVEGTFAQYLSRTTLRPRTVTTHPMLVETAASEQGWESIAMDDPEVQEILREHGSQKQVTVVREDSTTRVRRAEDGKGALVAERFSEQTHAALAAQYAASGFRFLTSDEWEWACGGGASTLFRWGDHVPCSRYPTDVSPAEAAWRRQWVLSSGTLPYPPEGFPTDWDFHRRPNAVGLSIAENPYKNELVAEIGTTRGGDGGCSICGGTGFFAGWLPLATSYFDPDFCTFDAQEPFMSEYTVGRRVLDLSQ